MLGYFFQFRHALAILGTTALAATMIAFQMGALSKKRAGILLAAIFLLGALHFTRAGSGHNGRNLHFNEFTHYYFGGKYFREVGYTNLYQAIALGLDEAGVARIETIRNLEDKSRYLSREQFMRRGDATRNLFSQARWNELKEDLVSLQTATTGQVSWQQALRDAGYNASPAGVLSSRIFTWMSPKFFKLITSLDVILFCGTLALLAWSFGSVPMLAAGSLVMLFPSGPFAIFDYSGGSCLRMLWVFWLTLGLVLYQRYPLASGGAFALATLERIFPAAFAVAAVVVAASMIISSSPRPVLKRLSTWSHPLLIIAGGVFIGSAVLIASELIWSGSWGEFFPYIKSHSQTLLFTNHFGFWRAIAFYPQISEIAFSPDNPNLFSDWSQYLRQRLGWPYFRLVAFGIGSAIWLRAGRSLPGAAAISLMGFALIFLVSMPAHYYLIMLLPIAASLCDKKTPTPMAVVFWITWPLCSVATVVNEVSGWALASILMLIFLVFIAGYLGSISQNKIGTSAGLVTLLIFLHLIVVSPQAGTKPPQHFQGAEPVALEFSPTLPRTVSRIFPDQSGSVIADEARILKPGMKALLRPPAHHSSGSIRIILRTDRFFSGTLSLKDPEMILSNWDVEGRGYLFDYLEARVPFRPEYQLEWIGKGDIGLFQAWVQGE